MGSPLGLLALVGLVVLVVGIPTFRAARSRARRSTAARSFLIVASLGVIGGAISLWSWIFHLEPPFSESPSGLFLIIGRGTVVGVAAIAAGAALVGATFGTTSSGSDFDER